MAALYRGMFASLRARDFRLFWIVTVLNNAGNWAFTLGISWQLYALTRSSLWVGAALFATLAPSVLGSPLGGVLADRLNRRDLLVLSVLSGMGVAAILAGTLAAHSRSVAVLLLLALAYGMTTAIGRVAFNALLPGLVAKGDLLNAISLQAVAQRGTELAGPALASPLLVAFGASAVFWFVAALQLAAALVVWAIARRSQAAAPAGGRLLAPLAEGLAYIRQRPAIRMLMVLVGLHCSLTMSYLGVLPSFVRLDLHASASFYGWLVSLVGLGAIVGTLALTVVSAERTRGALVWLTAVFSGLSLSLVGLARADVPAGVAIVAVGASQAMFMTLTLAYVQSEVADVVRGRVVGVYFILAAGLMSLANWAYGALGTLVNPGPLLAVLGGVFVVVVCVYSLGSPVFRALVLGRWAPTPPLAAPAAR